jgi:hypothetical protein
MLEHKATDRLRERAERQMLAKMSEASVVTEDVVVLARAAMLDFERARARPSLSDRILHRLGGIRWLAWAALGGLVLAILLLFGSAAPARAELFSLGRTGAWEVFGGTTERGQRTCAAGTSLPGPAQRMVLVQHYAGERVLWVRLSRRGWALPAGADIRVRIAIGATSWHARAQPNGPELRWVIDDETMTSWEAAFRRGLAMEIGFLTGDELPWMVSLQGSSSAIASLAACIRALGSYGTDVPPDWATRRPFDPAPPAPPGRERRT